MKLELLIAVFFLECFTPRTDNRFLLHDLDISKHLDLFPILYDLAHVAGWEPYNLHDLGRVSWVGSVPYTDPAQSLATAGEELDYLDDLSDLSVRGVECLS